MADDVEIDCIARIRHMHDIGLAASQR
jgi:hypothetical protein